jgi:hypothetical protein
MFKEAIDRLLQRKVKDLEEQADILEWALAMEQFPKAYLQQPYCKRIAEKRGFTIKSRADHMN